MTKRFLWMMAATVVTSTTIYAAPSVTSVSFSQEETGPRTVTVNYTLANEEAIITMDVLTNNVSIGDENIHFLEGDVNRLVQPGNRQIRWLAQKSWPGHKIDESTVKVRVNAWSRQEPPDYMVVDLETPNNVRYYTSTNALPDGGLTNRTYASRRLVMRYVEAADVTYTMGMPSSVPGYMADYMREHSAHLDKNYYIGIYTITQGQWKRITGWYPSQNDNTGVFADREISPVQYTAFNEIRQVAPVDNVNATTTVAGDINYDYPAPPAPASWLGQLSSHAGVNFDLPSECEWEYACRAGNYGATWGDGSPVLGNNGDDNLARIGRYGASAAYSNSGNHLWLVGSLAPNSWGIYDMHGNLWEWCLDYLTRDISVLQSLNGAVNTTPNSGEDRVERGGGYHKAASGCYSGYRTSDKGNTRYRNVGFRVVSRIEP